jgi:flagellar hook assembly protein FlgD
MDAQGRKVRTFGGDFVAGLNEVVWDGTDDRGRRLGPGVYFSDLDVAGTHHSSRLVWVK